MNYHLGCCCSSFAITSARTCSRRFRISLHKYGCNSRFSCGSTIVAVVPELERRSLFQDRRTKRDILWESRSKFTLYFPNQSMGLFPHSFLGWSSRIFPQNTYGVSVLGGIIVMSG